MDIENKEFPYDINKQKAIKSYFKDKANPKKNMRYNYSNDGNLEVYDVKKGEVIDKISLDYYRPITKDEFDTLDTERINTIIAIEEQIEVQKLLLRKAYIDYKETNDVGEVVVINQEITNLEKQKVLLRSPVRFIKSFDETIEKRSIYFDMHFEKRKVADVSYMVYRDLPLWTLYGKYTSSADVHQAAKQTSLVEGQVYLKNGKIARIFNNVEDDNGFLSIFNVKEFVYKKTNYLAPYQAFEVLRLTELGFVEVATKIMNSRAINFMKIKGKQFSDPLKNTKIVWKDILTEYAQQNNDLLEALMKTNDDVLVFANTTPYLGGVGLAGQDAIDSAKWKYPNIVGEVLMEIRSEFKENEKTKAEAFTQSVVSEEDVEKKKKAAIINVMKNRNH